MHHDQVISRKRLEVVAWVAIGSWVLGAATLGVPGALLIVAASPVMRLIAFASGMELRALRWDWWRVAMWITAVWPLALLATLGAATWAGLRGRAFAATMVAGTMLGALCITVAVWAGALGWLRWPQPS